MMNTLSKIENQTTINININNYSHAIPGED